MEITLDEVIVWIIIGAITGYLIAILLKRERTGKARWVNLLVGMAGALFGGMLFDLFGIDFGLGKVAITLEDVVTALIGSLILIFVVRKVRGPAQPGAGEAGAPPKSG